MRVRPKRSKSRRSSVRNCGVMRGSNSSIACEQARQRLAGGDEQRAGGEFVVAHVAPQPVLAAGALKALPACSTSKPCDGA